MKERRISIGELATDPSLGLELVVAAGHEGLGRSVRGTRIQKSGLALAGHFHGIDPDRVQLLGVTEMTYLRRLGSRCGSAVARFFERRLCGVVVTDAPADDAEDPAFAALCASADAVETALIVSPVRSSRTIMALHALLDDRLAPRERIHGVLVDVFEVGLLLLGSSGVGKSEVALELIMRGHRLVADDVVDCSYRPPGMVFGQPADLLRHHLEVRGLGILNIKDLFGVTSIRERKRIDVVAQLADDPDEGDYDRLGLDQRSYDILGVSVPELLIPVRPGRDMASIMEIAARNELLKMGGHHPARDFFDRFGESANVSEVRPGAAPRVGRYDSSPLPRPITAERPPESSVGLPFISPKK